VSGDLDQPETLDKAFEGIDRAFSTACPSMRQVEQEANFIEGGKAGRCHLVKYCPWFCADAAAQVARCTLKSNL